MPLARGKQLSSLRKRQAEPCAASASSGSAAAAATCHARLSLTALLRNSQSYGTPNACKSRSQLCVLLQKRDLYRTARDVSYNDCLPACRSADTGGIARVLEENGASDVLYVLMDLCSTLGSIQLVERLALYHAEHQHSATKFMTRQSIIGHLPCATGTGKGSDGSLLTAIETVPWNGV